MQPTVVTHVSDTGNANSVNGRDIKFSSIVNLADDAADGSTVNDNENTTPNLIQVDDFDHVNTDNLG